MFNKIIAAITLSCFLICMIGCSTTHEITREEFENKPTLEIVGLVTMDGKTITFDFRPAVDMQNKFITGYSTDGEAVNLPFSQIRMVYVRKFDPWKSTFAVIGATGCVFLAVIGLIALLKESCPFIYSYDGEQYVFDGEPYGGAICRALQRSDLCRLEHLQPVNDEYRLLLTNEVNETQYTDEFKLWVVDHPAEVEVIQDAGGNLYTLASPLQALSVVDNHGADWSRWLAEKDMLYWDTDLMSKNPDNPSDLRDTLFIDFPRPHDAATAKFVVHASNTLWGSQMLRRMVELAGDQVESWYASLNLPERKERRAAWQNREEIFELQVAVWIDGQWVNRGEILGGGPFMAEERVVPLDLTGVAGDTLKIRLTPPAGFWKLNSLAVDYSTDVAFEFREIPATSIVGQDGADLRDLLASEDGVYYAMPETSQYATLTFAVPPTTSGLKRTLFAKVAGYYDMHLNAAGPPQADKINLIMTEPGYIAKFALSEYFQWYNEQMAQWDE